MLNRPIYLAPMEDVTDPAFRMLCKRYGADRVYTEFVNADALVRDVSSTTRKLTIHEAERPVAIQIYGKDAASMADAARIVETAKPDFIDINFGCPVKKVAGKGAGAGLLRDVPRMLKIAGAIVNAVHTPVTAKTRLGWDTPSLYLPDGTPVNQYTDEQEPMADGPRRTNSVTGTAIVQSLLDWGNNNNVVEIVGTYHSWNTEYDDIVLSGKVMLPKGKRPKRMILVSHYTVGSNAEAPSNCFSLEGILVEMGYGLVIPDYQGYGVTSNEIHPYLVMETTAIAVYLRRIA